MSGGIPLLPPGGNIRSGMRPPTPLGQEPDGHFQNGRVDPYANYETQPTGQDHSIRKVADNLNALNITGKPVASFEGGSELYNNTLASQPMAPTNNVMRSVQPSPLQFPPSVPAWSPGQQPYMTSQQPSMRFSTNPSSSMGRSLGPPPPPSNVPPTSFGGSLGSQPPNITHPPISGGGFPPPPTAKQAFPAANSLPTTSGQMPPLATGSSVGNQPTYYGGSTPPPSPGLSNVGSGYIPRPGGGFPSAPPVGGFQSVASSASSYSSSVPPPGSYASMSQPGGFPPPTLSTGGFPSSVPAAGYPSMPPAGSFPPSMSSVGAQQPSRPAPMAAPQQQRRLDPDQIPSPIQVIDDDSKARSGVFQTGSRAIVPPLVTTDFIVQDQGVCSPRFIRSTMYTIPCTSDMLKQSHMPFALNIVPFATLHPDEALPPIINSDVIGPVRCNRCKAYMCPYMQFSDGGRRFQCRFCGCSTEVPVEYFAHLDHTGLRVDYYDRPELCLGAYEFVATKEYCKNNQLPKAPAYIFMLEVSYTTVKNGLVQLLCSQMKEVLQGLPCEYGAEQSEVLVAFVTYSKELHFYNLKSTLARPQLMVVSDLDDMFVPLLDGFFVKFSESEALIDSLLAQIPEMFAECRETEVVLGPVIQAGLDALKSAERPGKLFIFHASLPGREAPGKLKARDDRKLIGTEREKQLLLPQIPFYTKLGQDCVAAGCGVDMYLFPNSYVDISSIAEVPRLTGGSLFKYTYFQADLDGQRLVADLKRNVSQQIVFDAVMRVRTSTGIRAVDFTGNFYMSNTTDVELATIDSNSSVDVEIKHDDKLTENDGAYVQAAILYTSVSGQRRLRVLNVAFNCCSQMADLFRSCELDVLINVSARQAIRQILNTAPKQVREALISQSAQILACYRRQCTSSPSAGQLILPECMKLLPLYINCLIHSSVLQGGEVSTDDRSYLMFLVNAMTVSASNVFFYPRLLPLHQMDLNDESMPKAIRCSYERLQDTGIYLIENGLMMFMWIGMNANPEWIQCLFGVNSVAQVDIDKTQLQDLDNPISRQVRSIIKRIRIQRNCCMKLTIVRQRDKLEQVFQQYLVEDRGANGTSSYVEYLCHIHKEIRQLLS